MATKLMIRVFSAVEAQEDAILNQIENDVDIALEDGSLDTVQYSIEKVKEDTVKIHDKVNDEDTIAVISEGECVLSDPKDGVAEAAVLEKEVEVPKEIPEIPLGSGVKWIDDSDSERVGVLKSYDGDLMTIDTLDGDVTLDKAIVTECNKSFSVVESIITSVDGVDVEIFIQKGEVKLLDGKKGKALLKFKPTEPLKKVVDSIVKKLQSMEKNLSNMSEATQKYFSCKHRQEVKDKQALSNLENLSPKVREVLMKKYNL